MTWNSGWRASDRSGARSSTSRSNGTSWCSSAPSQNSAHPAQQLGERRVPGHVGAQHQRVDEEPDQVIERLVGPPRHRGPDRDVVPGAQLGQQHRQRRLHHHEQRHALLPGQRGQPGVHLGRDLQRHRVPAVAGRRRARPVGRAAPAPAAPPPARPATTPPAATAGCPGHRRRPAAPAARSRSRRTAPAAAPTPAPARPAARRTPPTGPGPGPRSTSRRWRCGAAPAPARARPGATASSRARTGTCARQVERLRRGPRHRAGQVLLGAPRRSPAASPARPAPSTRWYGCPSAAGNTVRSTSCRAITSRQRRLQRGGVQLPLQPQRHRACCRSPRGPPAGR